ncbi:hypothetical protein GS415_09750 [Rhodococcus hoagii]|nr:hypothetical protein [Prescottella equi]
MKAALIRLERNDYVFSDDETGEVLVRSFMRRDEVFKQPNVMLSSLRAAAQVESRKLARVLQPSGADRVADGRRCERRFGASAIESGSGEIGC